MARVRTKPHTRKRGDKNSERSRQATAREKIHQKRRGRRNLPLTRQ